LRSEFIGERGGEGGKRVQARAAHALLLMLAVAKQYEECNMLDQSGN